MVTGLNVHPASDVSCVEVPRWICANPGRRRASGHPCPGWSPQGSTLSGRQHREIHPIIDADHGPATVVPGCLQRLPQLNPLFLGVQGLAAELHQGKTGYTQATHLLRQRQRIPGIGDGIERRE